MLAEKAANRAMLDRARGNGGCRITNNGTAATWPEQVSVLGAGPDRIDMRETGPADFDHTGQTLP